MFLFRGVIYTTSLDILILRGNLFEERIQLLHVVVTHALVDLRAVYSNIESAQIQCFFFFFVFLGASHKILWQIQFLT